MTQPGSILLTLDLQHGILGMNPPAKAILAHAGRAVEFARKTSLPFMHVGLGFSEGHPEIADQNPLFARIKKQNLFVKGTESAAFDPAVFRAGDEVMYKLRVSAFSRNLLDQTLRARGVDQLIIFGIATSGIVLSTVRQAFDLDYRVTVLKDACYDADPEVHRALTEKVFVKQATVMTVDEFIHGAQSATT